MLLRPVFIQAVILTLVICCSLSPRASAQATDSLVLQRTTTEAHSPRRALIRGAIIPGGGQIYNRQYLKLPFVYGALGGITYFASYNWRQHKLYTRAFQYKGWQEAVDAGSAETNPYPQFQDDYQQLVNNLGQGNDIPSSRIKPLRDNFRRNRDLSLFGIGLVYGLTLIDAFVSAHLLDFDVDEDLTMHVMPHPSGATLAAKWSF